MAMAHADTLAMSISTVSVCRYLFDIRIYSLHRSAPAILLQQQTVLLLSVPPHVLRAFLWVLFVSTVRAIVSGAVNSSIHLPPPCPVRLWARVASSGFRGASTIVYCMRSRDGAVNFGWFELNVVVSGDIHVGEPRDADHTQLFYSNKVENASAQVPNKQRYILPLVYVISSTP